MIRRPRACGPALALAGALAVAACDDPTTVEGFPEEYAGIGLELEAKGEVIRVVRTIEGGPSEAAGIKAGDEVVAINGKSTAGMSLGEVVTRLRGKPGSQLTLSLKRQGSKLLVVLRRSRLRKSGEGYQTAGEEPTPEPEAEPEAPPKKKRPKKRRR